MKHWYTKALQRILIGILFGIPIAIVVVIQLVIQTPLGVPLAADTANSFLATMAQVLAGILAIVFSLSVLAVDIASDRYTPLLFSYFRADRITWLTFLSLLICTLIAVVGIGVQAVPMYQWGFLAMVWFFSTCLVILPYYFWQVLRLLDPRILVEHITDEALHAIEKRDKQKVLEAVTSLGDVAIKGYERGEDEIVRRYLDALQNIQRSLVTPNSEILTEGRGATLTLFATLFGQSIRSPVLNQYYRIFKIVVTRENEQITQGIARLLFDAVDTLMEQSGDKEVLKGMLQQHHEFLKTAIKKRDISRFILVGAVREMLFPQTRTRTSHEYLWVCLNALTQICKVIVEEEDFELWKELLNYFSDLSSIDRIYDSVEHSLRTLLFQLNQCGAAITPQQWTQWHMVASPLSVRITPTNKPVIELALSEMERVMPEAEQALREQVQSVRGFIEMLEVTTGVYDVFFTACIYALYCHQFGYIKELWRHVNPQDASASFGNVNLVHLNAGFLTYQMVQNAFINWSIEDYHGGEIYVHQYYLLCLAYALQQPENDWRPVLPFFDRVMFDGTNDYSAAMGQDLGAVHTFLINLSHYADQVLRQCDAVVSMSNDWDDVFNGQASDALAKAKGWLENKDRRLEWQETAESIIRELPLDRARVESYTNKALEYYESQSQVNQLATLETSAGNVGIEIKGSCHIECPDKREFTAIALSKPHEAGRIGFEAVQQVVTRETAYIVKAALENAATEPIKAQRLSFDIVANAARMIDEAGYKATVLMATDQQIALAWEEDPIFRSSMEYEGDNRYIKLESTRLRIIVTRDENVVIMDRNAGVWTTIKPLTVEVTGCHKKPLAVCITAQENVDYRIIHPEAIQVVNCRVKSIPLRPMFSPLVKDNPDRIQKLWNWFKTLLGIP